MGVASPGLDLTVMNMHTVRGSPESLSGRGSPSPGLSFMQNSEPEARDVMDSQPQSLCSSHLGTAANGRRESKLPSSSPEKGDPRPKLPVKPKPCVLPKPAMPVKPGPGPRQMLSEVPSAEKINLLAGPKPYSSGTGSAIKRLCFSLKSSSREATNGKEVLSSFSTVEPSENKEGAEPTNRSTAVEGASGEEDRDSSCTTKCTVPFKVKPVPVAVKPERFPGTTVEEILAKIEKPNKENAVSPDRPRLIRSFFSQDSGSAVHLGPKGFAAFRRCSSGVGGVGTDSEGPVCRLYCDVKEKRLSRNEEESRSSNGQPVPDSQLSEEAVERNVGFLPVNSSSQPSVSCERDQLGQSSPPSSPGTKLFSEVIPGSPNPPAEAIQPPGAPYLSRDVPCNEALFPPGSPDVHTKPSRSSLDVSLSHRQAAGSPEAIADSWPPGSPMKNSLGHSFSLDVTSVSVRSPEVSLFPENPVSLTHRSAEYNPESHQCLTGVSESPGSPSILLKCHDSSDQPPGSPSCTQDSLLDQDTDSFENQAQMLPLEDKAPQVPQRRASEGVVQPRGKKMAREELGGSLAVLPRGEDLPVEQSLGGESNWSLSQSFEWSLSNRGLESGGKKFISPPNSPIKEDDDGNLMEAELVRGAPQLQILHQEAVSEEQIRREELPEAIRNSANLSYCKELEKNWRKAEGQQELHSALELSAPGGPSVQGKIDSPKLKGPVVAEEVTFQEEHDGFLHVSPVQEEGALQAVEPLPSVEQTVPPSEPCILFSEGAQVQVAVSCEEEYDVLDETQKGKVEDPDALQGIEPDPSSHWLDELLASPPPTAGGTKRSTSKVEDATGPENLLGWSRKDLHSEFGIVGADCSDTFGLDWADDVTKVKWPGETEQDREFSAGTRDWPNSYTVGDAKRQDMEFGTNQQEWTRGSPLLGNSSPRQEEWLTSYGSSGADQPTRKADWSNTYSINTSECQDTEPYVRKPGWPKLCSSGSDQQSSDFAVENTDWSSHYPDGAAETTHWPSKYHVENICCQESDVSPESAKMPSRCSIESHQETELIVDHSDVSSQISVFSASQLGWPSESDSGNGSNQLQGEFDTHQVEQPGEHGHLEPQQQQQREAYGFEDGSCQGSELNVEQSERPSRCDTGTSQSQSNEFGNNKLDGATEYDSKIGQETETEMLPLFPLSKSEGDALEFCAQKPVWSDKYNLNEFGPQESNFPTGAGDWVRDTDFSGTEQISAIRQDLADGFNPLDFSDEKVTEDLSADSLVHQAGNLTTLVMDEPQIIREGKPEGTEDLVLGALATSGDLKAKGPEAYNKPEEKQLDCILTFDTETSSASSNTRSMNPEEARELGAGQADLIYSMDISSTESTNVSDLRPTAVDGAEMGPRNQSYRFGAVGLDGDVMQHPGATGDSGERKCHSQRLSSPSCLLEGTISSSDGREVAQQKRPSSFHSCHSKEERSPSDLPSELILAAEKMRASPFPLEDKTIVLSDVDGGSSQLSSGNGSWPPVEQNGSQAARPVSQEDCISGGIGALTGENFILEDTDVLDNTAHRDRANLGRKRGHRAPTNRAGGALLEDDRNSWMFRDSTEPQIVSTVSDEEVREESKSRKSRSSPLSKGVKVPLFPGLSPSALKAKLRGRNRSVEEGDPQNETKEIAVQRSKSCKIAGVSGKPLVLPPKPEKSSGSESSSPNWLQVLKLKKKKT